MKSVDLGVLPHSTCFPFTPSETTKAMLFYPTWCGHYYCTDKYYMKRESYPPLLVMFIRMGTMQIEYRGVCERAHKGDIVLLDCSEPHYYRAENDTEFLYMHFDGSNAHEICRHIIELHGWIIQRDSNILVSKLLSDMVEFYNRNGLETPFESSMRIYRLFELLMKPTVEEQQANTPIEDAIQYIRANIDKSISLEELAGIANLSTYYFAHIFKQQTGFAPLEYVINTRIERAKILLAKTTIPVAEIAYEVGYGSSNSLINAFVKRVGVSPRSYRNDHLILGR